MKEFVPRMSPVLRSKPVPVSLNHAAGFAWEILRRRPDYRSSSRRPNRVDDVDLLGQAREDGRWGLMFRRRCPDGRGSSPAVLGVTP